MKKESSQIGGFCSCCKTEHTIDSLPAKVEAEQLIENLKIHKRLDFEKSLEESNPLLKTDLLFDKIGQMFGVLVCVDEQGKRQVLKAFSAAHNNVWLVEGWVEPLIAEEPYQKIVQWGIAQIKPYTQKIAQLPKSHSDLPLLKQKRKQISLNVMAQITALYKIRNRFLEELALAHFYKNPQQIVVGTGDCCAPKLLNAAFLKGYKPLSMAEFYFGKDSPDGMRKHGEFYGSCEARCAPILGFMLCEQPQPRQ